MVKKELGPNALILSTRTIKNGKLGLLGKPVLEITAAVDNNIPQENNNTASRQSSHAAYSDKKTSSGQGNFSCVVDDSIDSRIRSNTPAPAQTKQIPHETAVEEKQNLQSEVNELKDLVKNLAGQISQISSNNSETQTAQTPSLRVPDTHITSRANSAAIQGDHLLTLLIDHGINIETSRTIASFLRESLTEQELCNSTYVTGAIIESIQNLIEVDPPQFNNTKTQHRIAFVGPTGVGKTTTLAKVAASYLSNHSNSIALITIDTYRIAAVEQLKVYGEIMHLPVDVVISPDQLEKALTRHQDKELILIDTAGRSPKDSLCIDELAGFLRPDHNIEKHLVLSASTRENELISSIEQFERLGIDHTIFSKVDECLNLGVLLNIQVQNSNPLSYITNGQRVPEDLLDISPRIVAELIMAQHEGTLHE